MEVKYTIIHHNSALSHEAPTLKDALIYLIGHNIYKYGRTPNTIIRKISDDAYDNIAWSHFKKGDISNLPWYLGVDELLKRDTASTYYRKQGWFWAKIEYCKIGVVVKNFERIGKIMTQNDYSLAVCGAIEYILEEYEFLQNNLA